jgi:hypothetical protein
MLSLLVFLLLVFVLVTVVMAVAVVMVAVVVSVARFTFFTIHVTVVMMPVLK